MKKEEKKENKLKLNNHFLLVAMFLATLFMSVGYASINNVILNVNGTVSLKARDDIFIQTVEYSSSSGVNTSNSEINTFEGTMINSTVELGSGASSSITYKVTVHNNYNEDYVFTSVLYDPSAPSYYDNPNIRVTYTPGQILGAGQSIDIYITFEYVENYTPSSAEELNSYINLEFKKNHTVTYSYITTQSNYHTNVADGNTLTVTFTNDVPYDVKVTMGTTVLTPNTDYTYVVDSNNNSNKILTVSNVTDDIIIERYYEIIYDLNGGTNNANNPSKYLHGETVNILAPTKTGSTFIGWYDNSSFTGTAVTSTNGRTGTLTLYAKWGGDSLITYINNLVSGYQTDYTGIITVTSDDNSCTNTFAYDQTTDNNLRFIGATPCNYIKFNCDANDNCELWRIIGVMNNVDSAPVLKIMRNDVISSNSNYQQGNGNRNDWVPSLLHNTLNGTYFTSLQTNGADTYMVSAPWNIGGINVIDTASSSYTDEIATKSQNDYVGLIGPSDLGYAVSGSSDSARNTCLSSKLDSSYTSTCRSNNWISSNVSKEMWTLTKRTTSQNNVVYVLQTSGYFYWSRVNISKAYKPVVYISMSATRKTGNGSINTPYEIE